MDLKEVTTSAFTQSTEKLPVTRRFGDIIVDNMHASSPATSVKKTKQASIHAHFSKLNPTAHKKIIAQENKWTSTESKCSCDFYDVDGMELMASEEQEPEHFRLKFERLEPQLEQSEDKRFKLEKELEKLQNEKKEMEGEMTELLEISKIGQDLVEIVEDFDKNVERIIVHEDSGLGESATSSMLMDCDVTNNTDSTHNDGGDADDCELVQQVKQMMEEDKLQQQQREREVEANTNESVTALLQHSREKLREVESNNVEKYLPKRTRDMYVQACLCCECDVTDEEKLEFMYREEMNEHDYMMAFNQSKMRHNDNLQEVDMLTYMISEERVALSELEQERDKLKSKAEAVEQLASHAHRLIVDNAADGE